MDAGKEKCYGVALAGHERLRGRPGHDLPGHVDRRLPGQCLEVRARRHLHHDRVPGGRNGSLEPLTRAHVSDSAGKRRPR